MTQAPTGRRDGNISTADKLNCVSRELKLRYSVYPRLVSQGKLTQRQADREIAIMEEIAADLRGQVESELAERFL